MILLLQIAICLGAYFSIWEVVSNFIQKKQDSEHRTRIEELERERMEIRKKNNCL